MTKSEMHRVVYKFVPRLLTQDPRDSRVAICQEILDCTSEDENFLTRIITGNETWVYGYTVGNENAVFTTGWKQLAKTEKGEVGKLEHESHVDRFF
jgi:hypothetical protein